MLTQRAVFGSLVCNSRAPPSSVDDATRRIRALSDDQRESARKAGRRAAVCALRAAAVDAAFDAVDKAVAARRAELHGDTTHMCVVHLCTASCGGSTPTPTRRCDGATRGGRNDGHRTAEMAPSSPRPMLQELLDALRAAADRAEALLRPSYLLGQLLLLAAVPPRTQWCVCGGGTPHVGGTHDMSGAVGEGVESALRDATTAAARAAAAPEPDAVVDAELSAGS
eukprot:gene740-27142_t